MTRVPWLYIGQVLSQTQCHRGVTWRPQSHQSRTRNMTIKSVRGMAPAVGSLIPNVIPTIVKIILPTCTRNTGNVKECCGPASNSGAIPYCQRCQVVNPADAPPPATRTMLFFPQVSQCPVFSIPPWAGGVHIHPTPMAASAARRAWHIPSALAIQELKMRASCLEANFTAKPLNPAERSGTFQHMVLSLPAFTFGSNTEQRPKEPHAPRQP